MSITDELRGYADLCDGPTRNSLRVIADRIDAEHESACAEAYGNGVMSVPIALDESQWVKLPVDADGVSIRVGDVMEFSAFEVEKPAEWDGHTPDDAIERISTLGRGTCYLISAPQYGEGCQECSACGEVLDGYLFDGGHCPSCGRKVVEE